MAACDGDACEKGWKAAMAACDGEASDEGSEKGYMRERERERARERERERVSDVGEWLGK